MADYPPRVTAKVLAAGNGAGANYLLGDAFPPHTEGFELQLLILG